MKKINQNNKLNPSEKLYKFFFKIYDHFNKELYNNRLDNVVITLQRKSKTMGYFSANRWQGEDGNTLHEIAINPQYFANFPILELFQTLVHEQCHQWQYDYGNTSRSGYHNKEWADKMESLGLMPSSTGRVGGKRTGQKMADYAIVGGTFLRKATELIKSKTLLPYYDRHVANASPSQPSAELIELIESGVASAEEIAELTNIVTVDSFVQERVINNSRLKYSCPLCNINVWGKPELNISCDDCGCRISLAP